MELQNSPQECDCWGGANGSTVDVSSRPGYDTAYSEANHDTDILHERGAEDLGQYDRDEGQETQANEFG